GAAPNSPAPVPPPPHRRRSSPCRRRQDFSRHRDNFRVRALALVANNRDRLFAVQRITGKSRKIGLAGQRVLQQAVIAPLRDFDCTEGPQMLGHILRVEQAIAASPEASNEMDQRYLGSVAGAMKHALAEESATKRHAIKPADQRLAVVDFDGMTMSPLEQ